MKAFLRRLSRNDSGSVVIDGQELVGAGWLSSRALLKPHLLCGDLNAVPNATTYRRFASKLRDAQRALAGHRPRATFPSRLPLLRLDHVFVSDDLADIPVLRRVGLAAAVANAVPEVRAIAHWVATRNGGYGAVREFAEELLRARGEWSTRVAAYLAEREEES